jgi:F-type H+-transporting ATPase subunit delta
VQSAVPLPADVRERIEAALARLHGPDIVASFTENPDLLGGVRVKVGSDVYDGSVKAALRALEARF